MSDNKPIDDLIGKALGQYTILQEIGRGGMASVYSATQRSMNRQVAVKVLPRHFLHDPGFLERFEREVEVISHLEHPHILPIYDYGETDGVPYIAMRYLGGGSMAQMVRRGVPRLEEIEKPFIQIAEALDYAHQRGIIHRDLKPGNIMLDEYGNAYLSDFGIARVMGSNLTGSAIIGTPAYMSPEQAMGSNIDSRSDIYALGVVLFELITGREPYQAETPMSVLLKHINEPMPPISNFRENVPDAVQSVVDKATAKDPDDRFSSAVEMAKAFSLALAGKAVPPTAVSKKTQPHDMDRTMIEGVSPLKNQGGTLVPGEAPTKSQVTSAAATAVPSATVSHQQPEKSGSPVAMFAGIFVVLLIIAGAGIYVFAPQLLGMGQAVTVVLPDNFEQVDHQDFSIGIPQNLLPASADYIEEITADRRRYVWQPRDGNGNVEISLALVNASRVTIADYQSTFYNFDADSTYRLIDEATAPDGTLRQSYRVENDETRANGQIDVFYLVRGETLAVVEMYTSDAIGADANQLASLQTVLDSLRLKG